MVAEVPGIADGVWGAKNRVWGVERGPGYHRRVWGAKNGVWVSTGHEATRQLDLRGVNNFKTSIIFECLQRH